MSWLTGKNYSEIISKGRSDKFTVIRPLIVQLNKEQKVLQLREGQ